MISMDIASIILHHDYFEASVGSFYSLSDMTYSD